MAGGGQAAPAAGGSVQDGPDEVEAAGLAGEPADDLDPAAGLAEGPLDEVGVPDPLVMLGREPQVAGQLLAVGEQAADRGRVELGSTSAANASMRACTAVTSRCPGFTPAAVRAAVSKISQ